MNIDSFDLLNGLANLIEWGASAYLLLVMANVILSWVRPDPYNPVVRFIKSATEPVFDLVRRLLPFLRAGMIDFSPIVVLLLLRLVSTTLANLLREIAARQI